MDWNVLIADDFDAEARAELVAGGLRVTYRPGLPRPELFAEIPGADALVARVSTPVDRALLRAAARLKLVAMPGSGTDHIDAAACAERGIRVISAPGANTESAAELTLALLLQANRDTARAQAHVRAGGWDKRLFFGRELAGQTLGLIGYGRIGRRVGELARAFGMRVLVNDPAVPGGVALMDLLAAADCVSIHVPLTPATAGLIGAAQLGALRPGAVLCNLSRGGVVREAALAGRPDVTYVTDVLEREPGPGQPLAPPPWLLRDNVIVTPHIGAWTQQAQRRAAFDIVHQLIRIREEWPDGQDA